MKIAAVNYMGQCAQGYQVSPNYTDQTLMVAIGSGPTIQYAYNDAMEVLLRSGRHECLAQLKGKGDYRDAMPKEFAPHHIDTKLTNGLHYCVHIVISND